MTQGAAATPYTFHMPWSQRLMSIVGIVVLAGATVFMIVIAVLIAAQHWELALSVMAPCAALMAALTGYVGRDLGAKLGLRVAFGGDAVTLDLPGGRSLIHRPTTQHVTIPYSDIAGIETRLEAYESLGMAIMQRAYVLIRKSGESIFLFEDRALGTALESSDFAKVAAELAARAGVTIHDLGMVEGKGGVLAVWGTHAADWSAPSLPLAQQLRLWRHAAVTGTLALAVTILAIVLRVTVFAVSGQ